MKATYKVNGMTCGGCATALKQALLAVDPNAQVEVDLALGTACVEGPDESAVAQAVQNAGFEFVGRSEGPG